MDGWNISILVSFSDGLFSGAMLVLGKITQVWKSTNFQKKTETPYEGS